LTGNAAVVHVEKWVLNNVIWVWTFLIDEVQAGADQILRLFGNVIVVL
jgi:hypothetical protein